MTEKKMESRICINLTEEKESKQCTPVVTQQRPFNNAAFCKAPDMISKASIEMAKLILFSVWKSFIDEYDTKKVLQAWV